MNVTLPEPQHAITALRQVGVAGAVPSRVLCLDDGQRAGIAGRVGVPEISVPLNDQVVIGQISINDEFAVDDVLLGVGDTQSVEDDASGQFERRGANGQWPRNGARHAALFRRPISACVRACPHGRGVDAVLVDIEVPTASGAGQSLTTTALGQLLSAVVSDSCWGLLPRIDAGRRAERPAGLLARVTDKPATALHTGEGTAVIAALCVVRRGDERTSALLTDKRSRDVAHLIVIPERLAEAPCI